MLAKLVPPIGTFDLCNLQCNLRNTFNKLVFRTHYAYNIKPLSLVKLDLFATCAFVMLARRVK